MDSLRFGYVGLCWVVLGSVALVWVFEVRLGWGASGCFNVRCVDLC